MNTNGQATKEPKDPDVASSFSCLAHDAIELAELQAQLLALDAKTASHAASTSAVLGIVAACTLLGVVPVLLIAVGEAFVSLFGWQHWSAMLAAAGVGIALSALAAFGAWYCMRSGFVLFERSRAELRQNLAWIKTNLKRNKPRSF